MAWTRTNLALQLNDVHFLSRHIMSLSSHDHHSYLVIPLLQSIKVLEKRFFSWPLSLLLLFYGEFSEWAYAFSWIMLFQLVVFLMWPCIFLCHILVTSPSQLKKNTFCTRFCLEMFHFTHDIRRWNNIIF